MAELRLTRRALFSLAVTALADQQDPPPSIREFRSPEGDFLLTIRAADNWKTPRAAAEFSRGGRSLWRMDLPHEYGPRTALVSRRGVVVLFDEWINVFSPRAVLILDSAGRTLAQHSSEAVQTALGVPRARLASLARFGPWMTAPPVLAAPDGPARVSAGGRVLEIRLTDGSLAPGL